MSAFVIRHFLSRKQSDLKYTILNTAVLPSVLIQLQTEKQGSPQKTFHLHPIAQSQYVILKQALYLGQRKVEMRFTDKFVFFDEAAELSPGNEFAPLPQDELGPGTERDDPKGTGLDSRSFKFTFRALGRRFCPKQPCKVTSSSLGAVRVR
jgi:hypothetical protein